MIEGVNPFTFLEVVVEPRLTDQKAYYMIADPAVLDGLEIRASGRIRRASAVLSELGFSSDGIRYKIRDDFGCGVVEHRGWQKRSRRIGSFQCQHYRDLDDLQQQLIKLNRARASGMLSVEYCANGISRKVQYKTDREMQTAQIDMQRRIAVLSGNRDVRTIRLEGSKGLREGRDKSEIGRTYYD